MYPATGMASGLPAMDVRAPVEESTVNAEMLLF